MKSSLIQKLRTLSSRHIEISALLSDPDTINDQNRYRELSKEYAQLEPLAQCFKSYQENTEAIEGTRTLLNEGEPDLKLLAEEELNGLLIEKKI